VPARPTLEGIEDRWAAHWEAAGTYRFDRTRPRADVYAIDTPPPTVSGSLHVGNMFSYTHTDIVARYQRMRGRAVFYPMGWDDNGLPTERRVQNYFGVRCDPSLPYDPDLVPPARPDPARPDPARPVAVSRPNFVELCTRLTAEDEKAFEAVWRRLGLSVDWSLAYSTIDARSRRVAQRAFLRNLARAEAYQMDAPTLWDIDYGTAVAQAELEDREVAGAWHALAFHRADGGDDVVVETTRPELLAACVALVVHPDDSRYAELVGGEVRTPLFGVPVPVHAHRLADPEKGTGAAMVCTFGDTADVTWWRDLALPVRPVVGRDGRLLPDPPAGVARQPYAELAGRTVRAARRRVVELLHESGELLGEPRPTTHPVKFYEKGDRPLEIVTTRQWYVRNGGRDPELRRALLARGAELRWHPEHMRARYDDWVRGLTGDWLVSRQRYFGVPFPVWYLLDDGGRPRYDHPLLPDESALPVDPTTDAPPGYAERQRGRPGGFAAEPDVLDTWATSSLTPQVAGGWVDDEDLFGRVFPMDLRPQGPEIIRTWLFATVLRSHLEHRTLPWRDAAISGWILDPDRKKMSKSAGNVVTPMGLLQRYGTDAVRYWAASARLGVDTAVDEGQFRVGRRLATKLLNASRFVLGLPAPADGAGAVTEPVDRAMLARLAGVVEQATAAFDRYEHAEALARTESFFWWLCDDHLELVKARAYGSEGDVRVSIAAQRGAERANEPSHLHSEGDVRVSIAAQRGAERAKEPSHLHSAPGGGSAVTALRAALDVVQRLFAPFLPFVAEETWSWWRDGSVHGTAWPTAEPLRSLARTGDPRLTELTSWVLAAVRRAKSAAQVSMRAPAQRVVVRVDEADAAALRHAAVDLALASAATHLAIERHVDDPGVEVTLA